MDKPVFSELVGAIYDSAIDPARWPDTLDSLRAVLGVAIATIDLNRGATMEPLFNYTSGLTDAQRDRMISLYHHVPEIWGGVEASLRRPIDAPWVMSRITPRSAIEQMAYYREWAVPMQLADSAAIVLARDGQLLGSAGFATDNRQGDVSDAQIADLALLLPHFQRAARISGMLDARTEAAHRFETLIEVLVAPVITVGAGLELVHANASARMLLDRGGVLTLRHGLLGSDIPGLRQALLRIVAQLHRNDALTPGSGVGLPVRSRTGEIHTLHVMPLSHGDLRPKLIPGAAAAIFVSSAASHHNLVRDVLQSLFALTPAEVRVFELVADGATTQEAADGLGVARSTVRTHLLRVFAKTGVNRQADLIRMAAALATPAASSP